MGLTIEQPEAEALELSCEDQVRLEIERRSEELRTGQERQASR
jgi:hypothetical protein